MPIKTYRPTTQTLRYRTTLVNDDITTRHPHKPLLEPKQRTGGRRNSGDTTMWHRGGGHKRKLRLIDFKLEFGRLWEEDEMRIVLADDHTLVRGGIRALLESIPGVDAAQLRALREARLKNAGDPGLVAGTGTTHSIQSEATLADGTRAMLRATIRLRAGAGGAQSQPYVVLRWQEGTEE